MIKSRGKKTTASKAVNKKKSFNMSDFSRSFSSLDMNNYGSWPLPVKITALLVIALVIGAIAWAVPINNKLQEIQAAESEQQTLLGTYKEKESRARHLQEYKDQIAKMEVDFQELLNQLPKDTQVPALIRAINGKGLNSNIRFRDIAAEPEVQQEFFIEQPIRIAATGSYHDFGQFVSGLAELPRIITLHDFEVSNQSQAIDSSTPELNLVILTKTYRSKENEPENTEGGN